MKISLKNVGYEYPTFENNKNGIYNVSLEIDSHKRIAIVGHTGSGKSTLLKLIKRLDRGGPAPRCRRRSTRLAGGPRRP